MIPSNLNRLRSRRRGASLIDVAIGSMLLTVLLIPALDLIGKSKSNNRRLINRSIMIYEAEQLVELLKVKLSEPDEFDRVLKTAIDGTQKISVSDGPLLLARSQVFADPSMPTAKLLNIVVDVWQDTNSNGKFDTGEQGETLNTQWASPL